MNVHRVIRNHFRVIVRDDCLPIGSARGTRNDLPACWKELGYKRIAEIGVFRGHYSARILEGVPDCHLICVDPWSLYPYSHRTEEGQRRSYKATVQKLQPYIDEGRVTILRMTSQEAWAQIADESLDALYIDGNHHFDFCCPDIIYGSMKVRSGGMIGVHDYTAMRRGGVVKAVDAYTHCHKIDPWYVTREVLPTAFWVKP